MLRKAANMTSLRASSGRGCEVAVGRKQITVNASVAQLHLACLSICSSCLSLVLRVAETFVVKPRPT